MNDEHDFDDEFENLIEDYDLDYEEAEKVHNLMESEGLDSEEAMEVRDLSRDSKEGRFSWVTIIFIIILIALAYNHFTSKKIEENYGYKVETSGITDKPDCSSLEPLNPYDDNSGHFAGFEWGVNGNECGGNSDSFIEGCQEYQNQENAYQYCLSRSK